MAAKVITFFRPADQTRDNWSNQEIAEFYRVEAALLQSGVGISTDRGVSDEGDPWFVFCRDSDQEPILHFARIDGEYVVAAEVLPHVLRGKDFRLVLGRLMAENPALIPAQQAARGNLLFHPAALLATVVVTIFFQSSESDAAAQIDRLPGNGHRHETHDDARGQEIGPTSLVHAHLRDADSPDAAHALKERRSAIIASVVLASVAVELSSDTRLDHPLVDALGSDGPTAGTAPEQAPADGITPKTELAGFEASRTAHSGETAGLLATTDHGTSFGRLTAGVALTDSETLAHLKTFMVSGALIEVPQMEAAGHHLTDPVSGADVLWTEKYGWRSTAASQAGPHASPSDHGVSADGAPDPVDTTAGQANQAGVHLTVTDLGSGRAGQLVFNDLVDLPAKIDVVKLDPGISLFQLLNTAIMEGTGDVSAGSAVASAFAKDPTSEPASNVPEPRASVSEDKSAMGSAAASDSHKVSSKPATDTVEAAPQEAATPVAAPPVAATVHAPDTALTTATYDSAADGLVKAFISAALHLSIFFTDGNVVLIDTDASIYNHDTFAVKIWSLGDGSTISIVGIIPDTHPMLT